MVNGRVPLSRKLHRERGRKAIGHISDYSTRAMPPNPNRLRAFSGNSKASTGKVNPISLSANAGSGITRTIRSDYPCWGLDPFNSQPLPLFRFQHYCEFTLDYNMHLHASFLVTRTLAVPHRCKASADGGKRRLIRAQLRRQEASYWRYLVVVSLVVTASTLYR